MSQSNESNENEPVKYIQVDPSLFSVGGKKRKNKTTKNKRRDQFDLKSMSSNITNIKKELLNKIRSSHSKTKKQREKENESLKETKSYESTTSPSKLETVLQHLNTFVKKNKKSQKEKNDKSQKIESKIENYSKKDKNEPIIKDKSQKIESNVKEKIPITMTKTIKQPSSLSMSTSSSSFKKDPPYGILKGGKKPTYSQYKRTLKKNHSHSLDHDSKPPLSISPTPIISKEEEQETEKRRKRLERIKSRLKTPKHREIDSKTNSNSNTQERIQYTFEKSSPHEQIKKYRIKRRIKTFKLGKNDETRKVGISIKNHKTIKNIQQQIHQWKKTELQEMKNELRKRNLIRFGSQAPDYLIRDLYLNCILAGDLENSNKDYILHNYISASLKKEL